MKKFKTGFLIGIFYLFGVFGYASDIIIQGDLAKKMAKFAGNLNPESVETKILHDWEVETFDTALSDKENYKCDSKNKCYKYRWFISSIHSGFIASTSLTTSAGKKIIVVGFSGTDGFIDNTHTLLSELSSVIFPNDNINKLAGKVFQPFYERAYEIISAKGFKDTLKEYLVDGTQLYIVGHSKGGTAANIAAYIFKNDKNLNDLKEITSHPVIYTFGAPMPGDEQFQTNYNNDFPDTYSFRLRGDPIPMVPVTIGLVKAFAMPVGKAIIGSLKEAKWCYDPYYSNAKLISPNENISNISNILNGSKDLDIHNSYRSATYQNKIYECSK